MIFIPIPHMLGHSMRNRLETSPNSISIQMKDTGAYKLEPGYLQFSRKLKAREVLLTTDVQLFRERGPVDPSRKEFAKLKGG
jgi:hypothetical protein